MTLVSCQEKEWYNAEETRIISILPSTMDIELQTKAAPGLKALSYYCIALNGEQKPISDQPVKEMRRDGQVVSFQIPADAVYAIFTWMPEGSEYRINEGNDLNPLVFTGKELQIGNQFQGYHFYSEIKYLNDMENLAQVVLKRQEAQLVLMIQKDPQITYSFPEIINACWFLKDNKVINEQTISVNDMVSGAENQISYDQIWLDKTQFLGAGWQDSETNMLEVVFETTDNRLFKSRFTLDKTGKQTLRFELHDNSPMLPQK